MSSFSTPFLASMLIYTLIIYKCDGAACNALTTSDDCAKNPSCDWTASDECVCLGSPMDIMFMLDESNSMGSNGFDQAKQFVADMIADGVSQESNIHIATFGKIFRNLYNFTEDQSDNQFAIDAVLSKSFSGTGQTQHR